MRLNIRPHIRLHVQDNWGVLMWSAELFIRKPHAVIAEITAESASDAVVMRELWHRMKQRQ